MIKLIKKIFSYFFKKKNKKMNDLHSLVDDIIKIKDPFIYK